jgi:hypothetical protein
MRTDTAFLRSPRTRESRTSWLAPAAATQTRTEATTPAAPFARVTTVIARIRAQIDERDRRARLASVHL